MAHIVMPYTIIVMAIYGYSCAPDSHGLYGYGPYGRGLYSYGPFKYGSYAFGDVDDQDSIRRIACSNSGTYRDVKGLSLADELSTYYQASAYVVMAYKVMPIQLWPM